MRKKIRCDIEDCDVTNPNLLHAHHIIPRTDPKCTNDDFNIAILCSNHHNLYHHGNLEIIGIFPSTRGLFLVYIKDGICNVPALKNSKPYYNPAPKAMKVI